MTLHKTISAIFRSRLGRALALLGAAASISAPASAEMTWKNIQFGGFASQGYLKNTGSNDLFGDTSSGTSDFREYAANASWAKGKWRLGAQVFGQELGPYGNDTIKLDWATVDYQPFQALGFRAGRVKMPRGLYNEALDLDSVRPFVLLPQSVYDARLRNFSAAFNGGMMFGNVGLSRWGSVDYRAFGGDVPMAVGSGASDYFNTGLAAENRRIGMARVLGSTLFWNLPISGLRVGASYSQYDKLQSLRHAVLGNSIYDYTKTADAYKRVLYSIEYSRGDWLFAAEFGREQANFLLIGFGPNNFRSSKLDYGYVSASRRINSWLELGSYFSFSQDRQATNPLLRQGDYALSAKFDLSSHWIFKLEAHQMDGSGKLFDTTAHPQPVAKRDENWMMFAAKTTFSF